MFKVDALKEATKGCLLHGVPTATVDSLSTDTRNVGPAQAFIALKGERFDGHTFIAAAIAKGATCVIADSQYLRTHSSLYASVDKQRLSVIGVDDTMQAIADIARWQRQRFPIPLVAVTGSNGKTTTKEMVAWLLAEKHSVLKNEGTQNNHIGVPQTLFNLNHTHAWGVLELGTNHFGEIAYLSKICQPTVGVITNIGLSHLEFFKNRSGVFKEKFDLARHLIKPSILVVNADDPFLRKQAVRMQKRFVVSFGLHNAADFQAQAITYTAGGITFTVNKKHTVKLQTFGLHNIYNALAALAVARIAGLSYQGVIRALERFEFPRGRFKLVTINNTKFIDDTYNANPCSMREALAAFCSFKNSGRKIFVMGDMLELGRQEEAFHQQVGSQAAQVCDVLVTVGKRSRAAAASALQNGLQKDRIFTCASSSEARSILYRQIAPTAKDVVLIKGSRAMNMEAVLSV
ncbi:MAG: UDP-N-acetylmuramoyl-tripeptide--D-alanyl-D-alanine ligase [Candidatus Omnitrophica bacterium]|nr:UDP-N-acetylmuramoyl-tripeptide--D-alanyl-D-alanine ligase [Candidatus Omnitrophota bacterium]